MKITEIKRDKMPQIKGDDYKEMIKIFKKHQIPYKTGKISVSLLKAVQENAIPDKIKSISKKIKKSKKILPIIICNGNYIIDGHHRWLAVKQEFGNDAKIPAIKILLSKKDSWKLLHSVSDKV